MAKDMTVTAPGKSKGEPKEQAGCPFFLDGRCGYLERPVDSLMGEGDDSGDEEMEEEFPDEG